MILWIGRIEELTYSESADPHRMLGPHVTEEGLLIQAFIPTATAITVKLTGNGKNILWSLQTKLVLCSIDPEKQ